MCCSATRVLTWTWTVCSGGKTPFSHHIGDRLGGRDADAGTDGGDGGGVAGGNGGNGSDGDDENQVFIEDTSPVSSCVSPCSRSRYDASEYAVCVALAGTDLPYSADAVWVAALVGMSVRPTR